MARADEVHAGHVYNFEFNKQDFSGADNKQKVVVLVESYSNRNGRTRALISRAETRGSKLLVDLDEVYAVPVEKLEALQPSLTQDELRKAKEELKKRID
ncbi:hypothetical protein JOF41_002425 [Saccharothrix coeruleofusca]|uniref:hypothetical protein n=1 Tax=Saccharothrix coeruleofusca TaxID=33919 RepID=UPI001AE10049|nr:hypothetical protein [Saccharothrix coeruleofusca]MBP2336247.1 hypothetical protein [Saccharothrix coeruleofusca]